MFTVAKLFSKILRRGRWCNRIKSKRWQRDERPAGGVEPLENRLAMAFDVFIPPPSSAGGENWATVVVNNGSDAYLQVAATPARDLLIADNASFTQVGFGSGVYATPVNNLDAVLVYNGEDIVRRSFEPDAQPPSPSPPVVAPDAFDGFGLPDNYPLGYAEIVVDDVTGIAEFVKASSEDVHFYRPAEQVIFILPSDIDSGLSDLDIPPDGSSETIIATLHVMDGSGTTIEIKGVATLTDPNVWELPIVDADDQKNYIAELHKPGFGLQPYITVRHREGFPINIKRGTAGMPNRLQSIGRVGLPRLDITYDANAAAASQANSNLQIVRDVVGGVFEYGSSQTFDIFNEDLHQYVPGTLRGLIEVDFSELNEFENIDNLKVVPLEFQVDEVRPDPVTGLVELSFVRTLNSPYGAMRTTAANIGFQTFDPAPVTRFIEITGTFNPALGLVEITTRIDGVDPPEILPVWLSEVEIGLKRVGARPNWPGDPTLKGPGWSENKVDELGNALTLFDGHDFTASLFAELPNDDSEISLESPVVAGVVASSGLRGIVSIAARDITISAPVQADQRFSVWSGQGGMTDPAGSGTVFDVDTQTLTVESYLSSPSIEVRLDVDESGDEPGFPNYGNPSSRSQLLVTQTGSISASDVTNIGNAFTPSDNIFVEVKDGDIFIEGTVAATDHTYFMSSGLDAEVEGPYRLTTRSRITDYQTGLISGGTVAVTLANNTLNDPGLGLDFGTLGVLESVFDIRTAIDRLRVQASDAPVDFQDGGETPFQNSGVPLPYAITVSEEDDLIVDALAASSGAVVIQANGNTDLRGSVTSFDDITINAAGSFSVNAPLATAFGAINVSGADVTVMNEIRVLDTKSQDERRTDIAVSATNGNLVLNDAVSAINNVSLSAVAGSVSGSNRINGNVVSIRAASDVDIGTDARVVEVVADGGVRIDERSEVAISVRDASEVAITVNGRDRVRPDGELSPALYADLYGVDQVFVTVPNGSVDVRHIGSGPLELGDGAAIRTTGESMVAAGSVAINSTLSPEVHVFDAPLAVSSATEVRFVSTAKLPEWIKPTKAVPVNAEWSRFSPATIPGVYRTDLTTNLAIHTVTKEVVSLGGIKATDIRVGDQILLKDGMTGYVDSLTDVDSIDGSVTEKSVNGVYVVRKVTFESQFTVGGYLEKQWVKLEMSRATSFDTTAELGGQERHYIRVTDGNGRADSLAGKVFVSDGFQNNNFTSPARALSDTYHTPFKVTPVVSRTGFQRVKAINTGFLAADYGLVNDLLSGRIRSSSPRSILDDAAAFGGVQLVEGDLVILLEPGAPGAGAIYNGLWNGVYQVVSDGSDSEEWVLERYLGADQDADGYPDGGQLGVFAVESGPRRTSLTGLMYEVSHESVNRAEIEYTELSSFGTEVGTGRPGGVLVYEVSGEGGRNDSPGSLGKMLEYVHQNVGKGSFDFVISPEVRRINLEQALPAIEKELTIEARAELVVDGDEIVVSQTGGVVRSSRIPYWMGPQKPTNPLSLPRLVRSDLTNLDEVHGFDIKAGGSGSVLRGISVGGFEQGAAVRIAGASNVLLEDVILGGNKAGEKMPNQYGLHVMQPMGQGSGEYSTLLNSKIINSQRSLEFGAGPEDGGSGVKLDLSTTGVRIVGSAVGEAGDNNTIGVDVNSVNGEHFIGVRRVLEAETVARLTVTAIDPVNQNRLTVAKSDYTRGLISGTQLYDRSTDKTWTIKSVSVVGYNNNLYELELDGNAPLSGKMVGVPFGVEAGYIVDFAANSHEIVLPSGFDRDRLYLGQPVSAWPDNVIQDERDIELDVFESLVESEVAMGEGLVAVEFASYSVLASIDSTGFLRFDDEAVEAWLAGEVGVGANPNRTISIYGAGLPVGLRVSNFDAVTGRVEVEVVDSSGNVSAPPFTPLGKQTIHFGLGSFAVVDPLDIREGDRIDGTGIFDSTFVEAFGTPYDAETVGGEAPGYLALSAPEDNTVIGRFPQARDVIQLVDLTGTRITKIEALVTGETRVLLSQPIGVTMKAGVLFPNRAERNSIGSNFYGIRLKSGSSKINATDVRDSIQSGIRIEGVSPTGSHVIGGVVGVPRTTTGYGLSTENVAFSGNGLVLGGSAIEFSQEFFAGLGTPSDIRARANQVTIHGNVFGADITGQEAQFANGIQRFRNIYVSASLPLPGFGLGADWLQTELVEDDTRNAAGRYRAKYRHEDNPLQDPKLRVFESFDSEGNFHFNGRPLWPEDGGDEWWNNMPTLG